MSPALPEFTADRLVERIAEAMTAARDPGAFSQLPQWTQRVMRILRQQLLPDEVGFLVGADQSVLAEGVAVALAAKARDIRQPGGNGGNGFARLLAGRLALDAASRDVAVQIEQGTFDAPAALQAQVMRRLFAIEPGERRAFIEGLAIGQRLPELLDARAQRGTTNATGIYFILWLYWPEVARLQSLGDVARALAPLFAENRNLAGAHWEERIRKLANRIGLSFRTVQKRIPKPRPTTARATRSARG